jgi:hypothetical protein
MAISEKEIRTMARFVVEVPHEAERIACARVIEIFLKTGSHYLTHADWGCKDGDHKAWIVADVDSREEARSIVPAPMRPQAKVVQLNCFTGRKSTTSYTNINLRLCGQRAKRTSPQRALRTPRGSLCLQ